MSANKRGNIFGQGKPERPYEERDDPADVPQRATAAQLAARKIKTAKARRPAGASSGLSQSANFGAPQPGAFNFGASAPAPANGAANAFGGFGGNNAFGGSTTSSFPPAQAATPSSTFSSSSFPAFGGSGQGTGTGFNPQPPSSAGFNFTAGGSNPFAAASSAPATNGSTPAPAPSFGGSVFGNSQPQSNPFGGLGQNNTSSAASSGGMFGTSSAAPSGGMFGTSSAAPSGGLFGTTSGAANATTTTAPSSTPFTFGSSNSATTSTPATSGIFSGFGTSTQTAPPAQNNFFGGFGANAQKDEAPKQPAASQTGAFGGFGSTATKPDSATETPKQNSLFGGLSTAAQATPNATATAPASTLFNFGAAAQKPEGTTPAPSTSLFGTSTSATPSAPASAPASNPFANLPTATAAPSTPFKFGATSQAQDTAPAPSSNLFGSLKKPEEANSATAPETPKSNPFASLAKPATPPAATPAAGGSAFSIFGSAQDKGAISASDKDSAAATLKAPEAPKSSLFQPFSTPQPAKTNDVEKSQGGLFSAAQPKTSSGMFSQTFQPETNSSSNLFSKPASGFPSFTPPAATSTEAPKPAPSSATEQSNPFASLPTPSTGRPNLFSAAKEPAQVSPAPAMSNEAQTPEMPQVPKVHVPKGWAAPGAVRAQSGDSLMKQITDLTAQLQLLNGKYLRQISELPPTADWSSISLWHYQHATDIKKKIDNAKKQRAVSRGVTGNESSLSTKRKASDDTDEAHELVASKRARPVEAPASPTPQPSASTPKLNPPATATSNMFAKAIGNKPATPSTPSSSSNLFAPKTTEKSTAEPAKTASPAPSFGFTPSASTTNGTSSSSTSASGFRPSFGSASSTASSSSGFKPNFGSAPASGGGFLAQFTKTAKTYEELAAERKKKAMEEDYDSDEETEEQWSARYDKAEEERIAEEKKKAAAVPAFTFGAAAKPNAPAKPEAQPSGSTSPKANPFAGLMKPTSGASTPSLFTPKAASPAPSTGSQSVFNVPGASPAPSSNIFGHLSSGPSSNNQDESDEDDADQHEAVGSVEPSTPPKHNFGESEPESDGTQEQTKSKPSSKGSLLSRITRDNDSESEKENRGTSSTLATNGTTTPTNKPFQFFDFNAASKTAPPKSDTFAGDQTYKFGSPIKFGQAPATEKKDAPKFQFQPATPSASDLSTTPAKPPPSSIFNFAPSTGGGSSLFAPSGGNSIGSSVFSSRAATPLSEAGETSAASAAEDDEGEKHEQIDLSKLTEEEMSTYDIVFHTEVVLARHEVEKDGSKDWVSLAKGPLWILKDKETAKCSVRVRIPSGATPVNYQILPSLLAQVTGSSKKQVLAMKPAKEGGLQRILFSVKTPEIAAEMAAKYTESVPS